MPSDPMAAVGETSSAKDVIANVVFVHGLGGDKYTTWQSDEKDKRTFWPQWLYDELNSPRNGTSPRPVGVWIMGYPADIFEVLFFSKKRVESVPQRARNLIGTIDARLLERPLIFVTHSLGGILVKQMLRSSKDAGDPRRGAIPKLALSTRLVIFLATPHTGSSMASLARAVPAVGEMVISGLVSTVEWLPIVGWGAKLIRLAAKPLERRSVQRGPFTEALERGDPHLDDLAAWYRHNAQDIGVDTQVYYENEPYGIFGIIVDKDSANPGIPSVDAIGLDANHLSICKPISRNDPGYRSLTGSIEQAIEACPVFKETHLAVLNVGKRFKSLGELPAADRLWATKKVVHPIEKRLGRTTPVDYVSSYGGEGPFDVLPWQEEKSATSDYDLDRIIHNVWHQYQGGLPRDEPTMALRHEAERLKYAESQNPKGLTLIPIYYAARATKTQRDKGRVLLGEGDVADVRATLELVEKLAKKYDMDGGDNERGDTRKALDALLLPAP
jgi:hypothetical protein